MNEVTPLFISVLLFLLKRKLKMNCATAKRYYRRNPDKCRIKARINYRRLKQNSHRYAEYITNSVERRRNRYNTDANFKLRCDIPVIIRDAIVRKSKRSVAYKLLGCGREEFLSHIESLWKPGMSWSNYGEWEIDHIKPKISFDLSDEQQKMACFHYSNTQPLWMMENRKKGISC